MTTHTTLRDDFKTIELVPVALDAATPSKIGLEPTDLKVFVLPDPVQEKIGSIMIPDSVKDQKKYAATRGTLVAVGPNAFKEWGETAAPPVGVKVLFAQYAGSRFKGDDGEEYVVMNDEDVIGRAAR